MDTYINLFSNFELKMDILFTYFKNFEKCENLKNEVFLKILENLNIDFMGNNDLII